MQGDTIRKILLVLAIALFIVALVFVVLSNTMFKPLMMNDDLMDESIPPLPSQTNDTGASADDDGDGLTAPKPPNTNVEVNQQTSEDLSDTSPFSSDEF